MSDPYDFAHPYSSLTPHVLAPFVAKHRVFIETGSNNGHGIQAALDAGFSLIDSIEYDEHWYLYCCRRFVQQGNVTLFYGDSPTMLHISTRFL